MHDNKTSLTDTGLTHSYPVWILFLSGKSSLHVTSNNMIFLFYILIYQPFFICNSGQRLMISGSKSDHVSVHFQRILQVNQMSKVVILNRGKFIGKMSSVSLMYFKRWKPSFQVMEIHCQKIISTERIIFCSWGSHV